MERKSKRWKLQSNLLRKYITFFLKKYHKTYHLIECITSNLHDNVYAMCDLLVKANLILMINKQ